MGFGSGDLGMGVTFTLRNNASVPASQIGRSMTNLERVTARASAGINTAVSSITTGLIGLTIVAAALLGPFVAATSAAADFHEQMSEVAAKAQISKLSAEYQELKEQAIALGEATKFTAIQVAEGQTFLAQTGLKVNEILTAMPGLLRLASAGNLDLARSADIASNILIAMGLEASEMNRVADVLAATSVKANVSVEQLGESFKFAAPFARQLGIDLEQTAALVGMLGDMGVQGTLAGTAIKNFAAQTSRLKPDKLAKFGLTMADIADSSGNMLQLDKVMGNIIHTLRGMGNLKQVQAMTELFGLRGNVAVAAANAVGKNSKNLTDFTKILKKSLGAAGEISRKMLDNLKGDVIKFKSVVQTSLITAGEGLERMMRPVVQNLTLLVTAFKNFAGTEFGQTVIKWSAGLAVFTVVLLALSFIVGILIPALKALLITLLNPAFLLIVIKLAAIIGPILIIMKAISEFKKVLAGGESEAGFIGFMQKMGGVIMGVIEIWKTWNGETFSLSKNMKDSLERIGILEFVLSVGTLAIRLKEFMGGFVEIALGAWDVINQVWGLIVDGVNHMIGVLQELGFEIPKLTSDIDSWREAGKLLAQLTIGVLMPALASLLIMFLAFSVGLVAMLAPYILIIAAVSSLVIFWDDLTRAVKGFWGFVEFLAWDRIINPLTVMAGLAKEIFGFSDNNSFPELDATVNKHVTFGNTPETNFGAIADQAAKNKAAAAVGNPFPPMVIDNTTTQTEQITLQTILNGDIIHEDIIDRDQLDEARN